MTQHYEFARPGISSISVDGIEHKVNPASGLLEVNVMTPNLMKQLESRGAVQVDPAHKTARPGIAPPANVVRVGIASARPPAETFPIAGNAIVGNAGASEQLQLTPEEIELIRAARARAVETQGTSGGPGTSEQPPVQSQSGILSPSDEEERQALFLELDKATGARVDRRRSLQQLRQMKADLSK